MYLIDALVLPEICKDLLTMPVAVDNWSYLRKNLPLADSDSWSYPYLVKSGDIFEASDERRCSRSAGTVGRVKTIFGYVLMDWINSQAVKPLQILVATVDSLGTLDNSVQKLWETEIVPQVNPLSPDDVPTL